MVKFWEQALINAIATSKRRIKILEKHGKGQPVMQQKAILQKQLIALKRRQEK